MRFKLKLLLIGVITSLFLSNTAFATQFVDVVERSLFYDAVTYFTEEVPILATDRDQFRPLENINKVEFFKLLVASSGFKAQPGEFEIPYHDITGTEWYATYIKKVLDAGVLVFDEQNPNLNPEDFVTRAQGMEWILQYYGFNIDAVEGLPLDYNDVSPSDSYANISKIAFQLQLLHDYKSRDFNANKLLTRAEAIHVFYQLHNNNLTLTLPIEKPTSIKPTSSQTISSNDDDFTLFMEVWDTISLDFIDRENIDKQELMYGAITGMVDRLGDPYSVFFEPVDSDLYLEALEGNFDGIGIYITQDEENFIVLTPLKGSPAEAAGIKPNDIIYEVDDYAVRGMTIDELIDSLRGVSGTEVKLKIKRDNNFYIKRIIRSKIEVPFVESEMIDGIGILYYYQFTSNSNQQFILSVEEILAQNPKGLILDLRNNPGGYIYSSQQLVSRFLDKDDVYLKISLASGTTYSEKSLGPGDLKNIPLIILINEGTASASEITALALRDQNGSKIVGTQSFGKNKIQEIITYSDGSSLKLSIAQWFSPNGTTVKNTGITPDYVVELSDTDIVNGNDRQLTKAIDLIN